MSIGLVRYGLAGDLNAIGGKQQDYVSLSRIKARLCFFFLIYWFPNLCS